MKPKVKTVRLQKVGDESKPRSGLRDIPMSNGILRVPAQINRKRILGGWTGAVRPYSVTKAGYLEIRTNSLFNSGYDDMRVFIPIRRGDEDFVRGLLVGYDAGKRSVTDLL